MEIVAVPVTLLSVRAGTWHCTPVMGPRLLHVPLDQSCVQPHPTPNQAARAVLALLRARRLLLGQRGGAGSRGPCGRGPSPEGPGSALPKT